MLISSKGVTRVAQFITFVFLARLLTPEEFGWFGMITTAIALGAMVGSLGLRQSIAHELGQNRISYRNATALAVLSPIPLGVITGGLIALWVSVGGYGGGSVALLWATGIGVVGTMGLLLFQGVHLGVGHITRFSLSEAVPPLVLLAAVLGMLISGGVTLSSAIASYSLGFFVVAVFWFSISVKKLQVFRPREVNLWPMLKYGLLFAINLSLITVAPRVSMFILEENHGASAAGQFYGAVRITEMFLEVTAALAMVLFSDAARSKDRKEKIRRNAQIACWFFWLFLPIAGGLYVASPWLVTLILGSEYNQAVPALKVLALGLGSAAGSRIIYVTLAAYGKPQLGTPLIIGSLGLNAILASIWIPDHGLVGGAYALVAGQLFMFISYSVLLKIKGYASWANMFVPSREIFRSSGQSGQ